MAAACSSCAHFSKYVDNCILAQKYTIIKYFSEYSQLLVIYMDYPHTCA